jgi:pimeloyl-ACP methyl ester carboxylesterase
MPYPPPGRFVDLGTHRLHLLCAGEGSPTVVFDAALGASSLSWSLVQPAISSVTRGCVYDRAGFGWSDAGPLPRTAGRIADELHELLRRSGTRGPYLLVGHSFGGLVMRLFASRHVEDVAGLVLIEPAIPEEWANPSEQQRLLITRGTRLCRYGLRAARHRLTRVVSALVSIGAFGIARVIAKIVSRGGLRREDEDMLAPIWKLPPEARGVLKQMWTQPRFFEALGSQIETICESAAEVLRALREGLSDLPLVVISSASASPHRLHADAALARLSTRGRHVLASDSGHWIPLDAPRAVIDVITSMVGEIRGSEHP